MGCLSSRRVHRSPVWMIVRGGQRNRCLNALRMVVDLLRQLSNPPPSFTKVLDRMAGLTTDELPSRGRSNVKVVVTRQEQRRLSLGQVAALVAEYRTGATVGS